MGYGDDGPATGEVGFSGDESSCSEELIMIGEVSLSTGFELEVSLERASLAVSHHL